MECPKCNAELKYKGTLGAPGVGQSWECDNGHDFVKLGGYFIDTDQGWRGEPPWILEPADCI